MKNYAENRETCDDCGKSAAAREIETLQVGSKRQRLCEDCYLARRRRQKRR